MLAHSGFRQRFDAFSGNKISYFSHRKLDQNLPPACCHLAARELPFRRCRFACSKNSSLLWQGGRAVAARADRAARLCSSASEEHAAQTAQL